MRDVEKLIVVLLLLAAIAIPACTQKEGKQPVEKQAGESAPAPAAGQAVTTPSGLKYLDIAVGTGAAPVPGKLVSVHYTGWLENGTKFESSRDTGHPIDFTIGAGQVIPGWDEGVMTMKVGGKRKLTIPPQLAYGASGAGDKIPPNATLVFEVELVDAQK
ncbi:MAG TPA: FKBP-type peptidyl-prolyl cis-trans isomerase [Geobacteraceae bacterium]